MSRWEQIHRDFPLRALLGGWLFLCWLRALRWRAMPLHRSGRRWLWGDVSGARHLPGDGHLVQYPLIRVVE